MSIDLRDLPNKEYSSEATGGEGHFRQGLRSGTTAAGGMLQALAGRVAETAGADEFAARRYADSAAAQEQSQLEMPEVNDYHQIDGIRSGGKYLAGQFGSMVPMLGAGVAGAIAAPASLPAAALLGATAATAPLTIGGAIQRRQADPHAAQAGLTERNAMDIGSGLLEAGLSNVVPQFFGGKLIGRGIAKEGEHAIAQASKKAILAKNMSEGVVGQGATMGGIEAMHQGEETYFNPNRDKSQDWDRIKDSAISGAIVGAPFGLAGAGGELAHRRSAPGEKSALGGAASKIAEAAGAAKDYVAGKFTKGDGSAGVDLSGVKEFATETADFMKQGAIERGAQVNAWAKELYNSDKIPDSVRAELDKHAKTIGDAGSQAWIATAKFALDKYNDAKSADVKKTLTDVWSAVTDVTRAEDGSVDPTIMNNVRQRIDAGIESATNFEYRKTLQGLKATFNEAAKDPATAFDKVRAASRKALNDVKENDYAAMFGKAAAQVRDSSPMRAAMDMFSSSKDPVDLAAADIAAGKHVVDGMDTDILSGATPEARDVMTAEAESSRIAQVNQMISELVNDRGLSQESRDAFNAMKGDAISVANQMKVAGTRLARTTYRKTRDSIADVNRRVSEAYESGRAESNKTPSLVSSGAVGHINEVLARIYAEHLPSIKGSEADISRMSDTLIKVMQNAENNKVDIGVVRHLHSLLGEGVLRDAIGAVHRELGQSDKASMDNLNHILSKIQTEEITHSKLTQLVSDAIEPSALKKYMATYPGFLRTMTDGIRGFVDHSAHDGKGGIGEFNNKRDFERLMNQYFGTRAETILQGFEKEIAGTKVSHIDDRAGPTDEGMKRSKLRDSDNAGLSEREVNGEMSADEMTSSKLSERGFDETFDEPTYYGRGKNNDMLLTKEAHNRLVSVSESAAERVLNEQQKKYGKHKSVSFVNFRDLPDDVRATHMEKLAKLRDERLAAGDDARTARTHALDKLGRPEDIGMVLVEGMKQEGRLSEGDLAKVTIDSSKTSHLKSPSRIDTGVNGAIVDARKLVTFFQSESRTPWTESDNKSAMHRLARVFMEGVAAVQDRIGKSFTVPDDTVVKVFGSGAKDERAVTWGDLKGLSHAVLSKETSALTETLRDASRGELLNMKKAPEKIMSDYDLATSAEFERRAARGDKLSKEDVKAIYKAFETAETKGANNLLFRIESELEGRSDSSLVSKVDSTEKSLQARRVDTINKRVDAVVAKRAAEGKPMTAIERAKYTKDLMDGKSKFSGVEYGEEWSSRDEHMANLDAYNINEANALNEKNLNFPDSNSTRVLKTRTLKSDGRIYRDSKDSHGMQQEIGPDAQPHIARRNAGVYREEAFTGGEKDPTPLSAAEQKMVNRTNMDGSTHSPDTKREAFTVTEYGKKADSFISRLERSVVTSYKEMAAKIKELRSVTEEMSQYDRDTLGTELALATKPEDMAKIVDRLSKKYLESKRDFPEFNEDASQWGGSELKKTRAFGEPVAEGKSESRQTPGTKANTPAEQDAVRTMIKGKLGQQARVEFGKLFHAGDYERVTNSAHVASDLIRLSMHSLDPMSTGFHEVLHGFIQHMREADLHGVNRALYQAADSAYVRGKLREFLKNEPDALKQIEGPRSSSEERAAYMYQMWAAGKLELREAPRNILQKISDFIKKTLGMWTADERAVNIMQYLHSGEYAQKGLGDRGAVARALMESGTNKSFEAVKQNLAPIGRIAHSIVSTGDSVLESMHNKSIDEIRKMIVANTDDTNAGTGWISASRTAKTRELNLLMNEFAKANVTAEHMQQALEQLQSGKPASSPEARLLAGEKGPIRRMLDKLHTYATEECGVDLGDRGKGDGYFPVVWDISHIAANPNSFRKMLSKYERTGQIHSADSVMKSLLANDGNDFGIETNRPGMQAAKKRSLDFISKEDRAEFLQKDMMTTLSSYVSQVTRRAEWSRRFGDDSRVLNRLLADAVSKHGATSKEIATVEKYIMGVDGSLGDTIDPGLRRLFGNAIVYQNIRLLPMAVFSMAVDPLGIMVRGGSMKDSLSAFKRGVMEIKRGFDKNPSKDEWYQMAELMGVIDNATLVHTLGTGYSQGMVGDTGRRINDTFFRFNLVEQMNTSMRVAAIPAALKFMSTHADGTKDVHSKRWLAELDLKENDVVTKNGKVLTTQAEFEAHGMSPKDALAAEVRMRLAVNKWVDGAVLRPNAAHKPNWMNDPHYALIAHLKQFVYSFNETIIKRVMNEARYGNYTPAYALAGYVPTMIAADFIKGMVMTGGGVPAYRDDWDVADYVGSGIQRSGILMTGQFGVDMYKDIKMGGSGVTSLLGPQIEQIADGLEMMGGKKGAGSFAMDALPVSPIAKAVSKLGESKADPNFAD